MDSKRSKDSKKSDGASSPKKTKSPQKRSEPKESSSSSSSSEEPKVTITAAPVLIHPKLQLPSQSSAAPPLQRTVSVTGPDGVIRTKSLRQEKSKKFVQPYIAAGVRPKFYAKEESSQIFTLEEQHLQEKMLLRQTYQEKQQQATDIENTLEGLKKELAALKQKKSKSSSSSSSDNADVEALKQEKAALTKKIESNALVIKDLETRIRAVAN